MPKYTESPKLRVGLTLAALSPDSVTPAELKDQPNVLSVLRFDVSGSAFAVAVEHTEGVVDCPRIAPLPSPPEGLA